MQISPVRLALLLSGTLYGVFALYIAALVVPIVIREVVPAVVEAVVL